MQILRCRRPDDRRQMPCSAPFRLRSSPMLPSTTCPVLLSGKKGSIEKMSSLCSLSTPLKTQERLCSFLSRTPNGPPQSEGRGITEFSSVLKFITPSVIKLHFQHLLPKLYNASYNSSNELKGQSPIPDQTSLTSVLIKFLIRLDTSSRFFVETTRMCEFFDISASCNKQPKQQFA